MASRTAATCIASVGMKPIPLSLPSTWIGTFWCASNDPYYMNCVDWTYVRWQIWNAETGQLHQTLDSSFQPSLHSSSTLPPNFIEGTAIGYSLFPLVGLKPGISNPGRYFVPLPSISSSEQLWCLQHTLFSSDYPRPELSPRFLNRSSHS